MDDPCCFDTVFDRRPWNSIKWSYLQEYCPCGPDEILPMWIADADFASPLCIQNALLERAGHPVYGYSGKPSGYYSSFIDWTKKRHSWNIKKEWISFTPGIVPAIAIAIQSFTKPGDGIIIMPPVYHPFRQVIEKNQRVVRENPLINTNNTYTMDFDNLEFQAKNGAVMIILCSPHNPVGRVWTKRELQTVADIAKKYNLIVLSDEIHADLVQPEYTHIPFASVSDFAQECSAIFMAPSKTFNIAGLSTSNAIIPNKHLFDLFDAKTDALGLKNPTIFGATALEAAYRGGESWLTNMLSYVRKNYEYTCEFFKNNLPNIIISPLEATFLIWADFRALGYSPENLKARLITKGKVWFEEGSKFGIEGEGFMRINIACPHSILCDGLNRIVCALS